MRAGILTQRPSLPSAFFPSLASGGGDGGDGASRLVVGVDALRPEARRRGRLRRPIEESEGIERARLDADVLEALVRHTLGELHVEPADYSVLLSVGQDVPSSHIAPLLRLLLERLGFRRASIARQPSLVLFSYDVTTGVVVDLGERLHVVP